MMNPIERVRLICVQLATRRLPDEQLRRNRTEFAAPAA